MFLFISYIFPLFSFRPSNLIILTEKLKKQFSISVLWSFACVFTKNCIEDTSLENVSRYLHLTTQMRMTADWLFNLHFRECILWLLNYFPGIQEKENLLILTFLLSLSRVRVVCYCYAAVDFFNQSQCNHFSMIIKVLSKQNKDGNWAAQSWANQPVQPAEKASRGSASCPIYF